MILIFDVWKLCCIEYYLLIINDLYIFCFNGCKDLMFLFILVCGDMFVICYCYERFVVLVIFFFCEFFYILVLFW